MVVVIVTVDHDAHELVLEPEVITRGWIHADEAENLIDQLRKTEAEALQRAFDKGDAEMEVLQKAARKAAGKMVNDRTKRRPMIVPVVLSV